MGRRKAAGLVIVTLAAALAFQVGVASASSSSGEGSLASFTNGERTAQSVAALARRSDLDVIARRHSNDMAAAGRIYHSQDLPDQVQGCWTLIGENVGVGSSVDDIHRAFMDSPTHRSNILERDYNEVGIGVVTTDEGETYVTEVFAERRCTPERKVQRHVRAQTRRTPPPRVVRAHLQQPSSAVTAAVQNAATQNVDLLLRMMAFDAESH